MLSDTLFEAHESIKQALIDYEYLNYSKQQIGKAKAILLLINDLRAELDLPPDNRYSHLRNHSIWNGIKTN
jgi:hypothetical protein